MEKNLFRSCLYLITFAIGLVLVLVKFDAIGGILGLILGLLSPFFIGFVIAFVLNLPYEAVRRFLDRHLHHKRLQKFHRAVAIIAAYLLWVVILGGTIAIVIPELGRSIDMLITNSSAYIKNLNALIGWVSSHIDWVQVQQIDFSQFMTDLQSALQQIAQRAMDTLSFLFPQIYNVTTNIVQGLINLGIGLIVSVYLLSSKEVLCRQVKKLTYAFLPRKAADRAVEITQLTAQCFNNFISGQLTEACILGVLCFIGMTIFRFEYAFLISLLVGLSAIVPVVGAFIGTVPAVFLLLLVDPMQAVWFIVFIVVLQQIEGNLIYPKVVGESVGLPPLWVLMGIVVGGGLGGIFGMLLGVPVFTVLYKLMRQITHRRLRQRQISIHEIDGSSR